MLFCPIWLFPCYEQQNKATSKIFFSAGKKGCLEKLCSSAKIFLFWQLPNSIWHGIFPGHIVLQVLFCSWLQQRLLSFPPSFCGHSQRPQYRHRVVLERIDEGWWFLWYASSDLLSLDWKSFGLAVVVTVVRVAFFIWFYFSTEGTLWVFLSETEVCLEVSLALE